MTTVINIRVEIVTTAATPQSFSDSVSHQRDASAKGKENLALELFAELRKAVFLTDHLNALPDVGDLLGGSTGTRSDPFGFIDIYNVPGLWLEISNTLDEVRYLLAQAKAYKEQEPDGSSPSSNSICAHVHLAKMHSLNLAVFQLVKILNLVVRLLHESFSGKLIPVDYDDDDWDKKLSLLNEARKGLKTLAASHEITGPEYQAILGALAQLSKSPHQETVLRYRNRLSHAIRPSVDYAELYTELQDRAGRPIKDRDGKEIGRTYGIGGRRKNPEFLFADLYVALTDYMNHVVAMLRELKQIPRLS